MDLSFSLLALPSLTCILLLIPSREFFISDIVYLSYKISILKKVSILLLITNFYSRVKVNTLPS